MASFPVQVLRGLYLGVLTGIVPALVAFGLAVLFRHVTGLTVPSFAVVVLGVAIAGVNGGFLALNDPTIVGSANNVTLVTAVLVVMLVTFYAHNEGDRLGATLPRHLSWRALRERTLSADVVELVGGRGQVRVRVVGEVADVEGYPPLPDEVRAEVRATTETFPADLPLSELESRFAERLRTDFDLAEVTVSLDERARATVTAAPPLSGVSKRVPPGKRAVSVDTLVPTGLARGDDVTVVGADDRVSGTVVSARSAGAGSPPPAAAPPPAADGSEDEDAVPPPVRAPTTAGGEGRVTVATGRGDAESLLRTREGRLVVHARGKRREYELLSLLRRAGKRIQRVTVAADGPLDGATLGEASVRDAHDVAVLAVRHGGTWTVAPRGDAAVAAGDDLFVAGGRAAIESFREAVA